MKRFEGFPRAGIARLPTVLEPLPRLSAALDGPELWIKRDDQIGLAIGGNKTRKLDFLVGEALAQGARRVVTFGGPQSNHARQTAAAARRVGLEPILVLVGDEPAQWQGNLLLDRILGARVCFVSPPEGIHVETPGALLDQAQQVCPDLDLQDAYVIPMGGTCPVGVLGYAEAALELHDQARTRGFAVDHTVTALGTGGTAAGLLAGFRLAGADTRVVAVDVGRLLDDPAAAIARMARETAALLGTEIALHEAALTVHDYTGERYARPTPACLEAIQLLARHEGILLDPVYTGKALAGLVDLIRQGRFRSTERVVFWHTGGTPALYVDPALF